MADQVCGLTAGTRATFTREVTAEVFAAFVTASGDTHPLHADPAYAARTRFESPIVHGMLGAAFISAALGLALGGIDRVMVYVAQDLRFRAPVRLGDTLTVTCEVTAVDVERSRVTVDTTVTKGDGSAVITGTATMLVEAPAPEAAE